VALTGNVLQEHRDRCIDVGMDDYIGKPYPPEILHRAVDRWISQRRATSSRSEGQHRVLQDDSSVVN
jgi:CheY-like chemotaxis protein